MANSEQWEKALELFLMQEWPQARRDIARIRDEIAETKGRAAATARVWAIGISIISLMMTAAALYLNSLQ